MKLTFPHMGTLWIALKDLFEMLGHEVIPPPPVTKKTMELGIQNAPEMACLPLKVNLGNFIEAIELGADTLIMPGGCGPCRLGYYAQVERSILSDLGYDFNMIVVEPPGQGWALFFKRLRGLNNGRGWQDVSRALYIAWQKICVMDFFHRLLLEVQPYNPKEAQQKFEKIMRSIEGIKRIKTIKQITQSGKRELLAIKKQNKICFRPLRIAIVGEVFLMWEPYVNCDIEKLLGRLHVQVIRSASLSNWIKDNILKDPMRYPARVKIQNAAKPYLGCFVGGHGRESVGDTVQYARKGFDGIIHLYPLACTPEIVAQSTLVSVIRDHQIPVLTLSVDEHFSKTGMETRIEAFVDLLQAKKQLHQNPSTLNYYN